jgi:hypothetical protein
VDDLVEDDIRRYRSGILTTPIAEITIKAVPASNSTVLIISIIISIMDELSA